MAVAAGRPTQRKQPENPLTAGLERQPVPPTTLVIFGATGDLARRKLLPALYNLAHDGGLPERFYLIGVARKEKDHEDYRRECAEAIERFSRRKPDPDVLKGLLENVRYVPGTFDEDSVYEHLGRCLDANEKHAGEPLNRAFYLSTAPAFFPVIVGKLGESNLSQHEDAQVRWAAVFALDECRARIVAALEAGEFAEDHPIQLLMQLAAGDSDAGVRQMAATTLEGGCGAS